MDKKKLVDLLALSNGSLSRLLSTLLLLKHGYALKNIQEQLLQKLLVQGTQSQLSPREKSILIFIGDHAGSKSGDIAKKLAIPNPTVKRLLSELMTKNLIEKHGLGAGTNHSLK